MTVLPFLETLPVLFSSIALDDSSVGLLAMLLGLTVGWTVTGMRDQAKAKKAKAERERRLAERGITTRREPE